jgi:hypothetical protein
MIACCTTSFKDTPNTSHLIDDQVTELDWAIQKLQHRRRELSTRRNLLAPIARLPLETLVRIFWLCIESKCNRFSDLVDITSFRPYTWISHICRAWRNVSLDTPLLWTRPLFSRTPMTEAMVARAKGLPLTVKCNLTDSTLAFVSPVLQTQHFHSIALSGVSRRMKMAYTALARDLPHIQSLRLEAIQPQSRNDLENNEEREEDDDDRYAFMTDLEIITARPCHLATVKHGVFAAPNLSKICLVNTLAPQRCGLFSHVIDFTLHLSYKTAAGTWSANEILETLSQMPGLQLLNLCWSTEQHITWTSRHVAGTFLPGLRRLCLRIPVGSR